MSRLATTVVLALLLAASAVLYFYRLDSAPPHTQIDEAMIAINAHAIATTGRDIGGAFLPLYTQTDKQSWYQPVVIYTRVLTFMVLPLNEWSMRVPTVLLALTNIALMFLLILRLYGNVPLATAAGGMLALTPGHFIHGRYGLDYLYPVTFILGWLLCLAAYREHKRERQLWMAAGVLGLGFYCYISSIVLMPLYLALMLVMLPAQHPLRRRVLGSVATFAALLLPFLIWVISHPEAYGATVSKYGLYDNSQLNAAQGLRSSVSFLGVSQRLSQYWNYFDPSLLFFGSGIKVQFSTSLVGVFLLPVAVFMVAGLYAALKHRDDPFNRIVLLGFVTAPLAAVIPTEENAIFRALGLLPFGIIIATIGVRFLWGQAFNGLSSLAIKAGGWVAASAGIAYGTWSLTTGRGLPASMVPLLAAGIGAVALAKFTTRSTQLRAMVIVLLAAMPVQFGGFWTDYFGDYRVRSAFWLGGNLRGAMEELIDRADAEARPDIYFAALASTSGQLDWRNDFIETYWRFYLAKHDRLDLEPRGHLLGSTAIDSVPRGSLVLANVENGAATALAARGGLTRVTTIDELDGRAYFVIYQR